MNYDKYFDKLVDSIFKILPLSEEDPLNTQKYLQSLLIELKGGSGYFSDNPYFIKIIFSLEGIGEVTDHNVLRSKVFECISLLNKMRKKDD